MDQVTSHVLMIRPSSFGFNSETAENNTFQTMPRVDEIAGITQKAKEEFDDFVDVLRKEGVDVTVVDDSSSPQKPDAVFPNNWISFHRDGTVITYPMYSSLRRNERRDDIIDELNTKFQIGNRLHLEYFESAERYLEGTGSLVLDRANQVAYASISDRTHQELVEEWCSKMNYIPHTFHAMSNGKPIYHTNVMMAIASQVAVVCLECLPDENERRALKESLAEHHAVVKITEEQVNSFTGNMLALKNRNGEELMVMSTRALSSLTSQQKEMIEKYSRIISSPINTIEDVGGGSARCMIAEIFLQPK